MPARKPEDCDLLIAEYINSGNVEAAVALYEPTATFLVGPGKPVTGHAAIREHAQAHVRERGGREEAGSEDVPRVRPQRRAREQLLPSGAIAVERCGAVEREALGAVALEM